MVSFSVLQAVLFAGASFYCYPWKPFLNFVWGDSYAIAYKHFREDHKTPLNLGAHLICLSTQVLGNFGFLFSAAGSYFALVTCVAWVAALALFGPRSWANVLACGTVVVAYVSAGYFSAMAIELGTVLAFVSLFVAADFLNIDGKVHVPISVSLRRLALVFGLWWAVCAAAQRSLGGLLGPSYELPALFFLLLVNGIASGVTKSPTVLSVVIGMAGN